MDTNEASRAGYTGRASHASTSRPFPRYFRSCHAATAAFNYLLPILLLIGSNVVHDGFGWYGHLRFKECRSPASVLASWLIASVEYCMAVPANAGAARSIPRRQLKTIQEVVTLLIFAGFSILLSQGAHDLELRRRLRLYCGGGVLPFSAVPL